MRVLLEHKKRKNVIPHKDYNIEFQRKVFDYGEKPIHGIEYNATRKDGTHAGKMQGYFSPKSRSFHVGWAGAKDFDARDDASEHARLSGQHHLPKSLINPVMKHLRKTFPQALRMTAHRISGVRPGHRVDVPLNRPSSKEVAKQKAIDTTGTIRKRGYEAHDVRLPGVQGNVSINHVARGHGELGHYTGDLGGWKNIRKLVKLARSTGKFNKLTFHTQSSSREVILKKPKKSTVFMKSNGPNGNTSHSVTLHHSKKGQLADFDVDSFHANRPPHVDAYLRRSDGAKRARLAMTFGQKRRLYRVLKDRILPKLGHTGMTRDKYDIKNDTTTRKLVKSKKAQP